MAFTAGSQIPNPLEPFTSFNNIFTLAVLTPDEINFPGETYRRSENEVVIARSGGGLGDKKVTTAFEVLGKVEYFIDEVSIDTIISPSKLTGVGTATSIKFTVHEPYSMGLFMNSLQIGALQAGYNNHFEAPYLLKIEFKGYGEDNSSYVPPASTRYFPIKITNVQFEVTAGGSVYNVEAIAWNEQSYSDQVTSLKTDANLTGPNLQEILQTGPRSLRAVINERLERLAESNNIPVPDQVLILFPENSYSLTPTQLNDYVNSATVNFDTTDDARAAARFYGGDLSNTEQLRLAQQQQTANSAVYNNLIDRSFGASNSIGQATIARSILENGSQLMGIDEFEIEETPGGRIYNRGDLEISPDLRNIQFRQGTDIVTIIEDLVTISSYAEREIVNGPNTNNRYSWFRVETETYVNPNYANTNKTNKLPKIHVFKVVPYEVGTDHFKTVNTPLADIGQRIQDSVKEYNYIYTGKNKDILDFDIEIKFAYFNSVPSDIGQSTAGQNQNTSASAGPSDTDASQRGLASGEGIVSPTPEAHDDSADAGRASTPTGSGGNSSTALAQNFHNSIINSDVDLINLTMEIMGDPYYLPDSGIGNYNAREFSENLTQDGSINYQPSEVDVIVNFRTPVDYKLDDSGEMLFPEQIIEILPFSGLYRVHLVRSRFSGNSFTQELEMLRRKGQEDQGTTSSQNRFIQVSPEEAFNFGLEPGSAGTIIDIAEISQQAVSNFVSGIPGLSPLADNIGNFIDTSILETPISVANAIGSSGQDFLNTFNSLDDRISQGLGQFTNELDQQFDAGLDRISSVLDQPFGSVNDALESATSQVDSALQNINSAISEVENQANNISVSIQQNIANQIDDEN